MTLNEFLAKAGQLLGLAEKNLTAEQELTQLKANLETVNASLSAVQADLITAKASIASLTGEKEKLSASVTDLTAKLEAKGKEVETASSRKALEITAAQGQPPIESKPAAEGQSGDILAQYEAIKDAGARTTFYRKNKAAYDAAFKAKQSEK